MRKPEPPDASVLIRFRVQQRQAEALLSMSLLAHAYFCRLTPIFQGKRSGNWNRNTTFRGRLRVVTEHVIAKGASLLPRGANANALFVPISKTEDALRIAIHDLDQIGQGALHLSRVQSEVRRSAREFTNALDHALAVGCHLRTECTEADRRSGGAIEQMEIFNELTSDLD